MNKNCYKVNCIAATIRKQRKKMNVQRNPINRKKIIGLSNRAN